MRLRALLLLPALVGGGLVLAPAASALADTSRPRGSVSAASASGSDSPGAGTSLVAEIPAFQRHHGHLSVMLPDPSTSISIMGDLHQVEAQATRAVPGFDSGLDSSAYLTAPTGGFLVPGTYPTSLNADEQHAGMAVVDLTGAGVICNGPGTLDVLQNVGSSDGTLLTFAADYVIDCGEGPALQGSVRLNSSLPYEALEFTLPDAPFDVAVGRDTAYAMVLRRRACQRSCVRT